MGTSQVKIGGFLFPTEALLTYLAVMVAHHTFSHVALW